MVNGIDVSHYQGTVDWGKVAASGIGFAFCKASDGLTNTDPTFSANFLNSRNAGIPRGAYHFLRPSMDAAGQAAAFLAQLAAADPGELPPVVDVEVSDGCTAQAICASLQVWLDAVQAALGRAPIIYTSASFWTSSVASMGFSNYSLWVAHYTGAPTPNLPAAWSDYAFWQFSENGSIQGVVGGVDLDRFQGSAQDLASFGKPPGV